MQMRLGWGRRLIKIVTCHLLESASAPAATSACTSLTATSAWYALAATTARSSTSASALAATTAIAETSAHRCANVAGAGAGAVAASVSRCIGARGAGIDVHRHVVAMAASDKAMRASRLSQGPINDPRLGTCTIGRRLHNHHHCRRSLAAEILTPRQ